MTPKSIRLFFILSILFIYKSQGGEIVANVASVDLTPQLSMKFALGGYGERMSQPAEAIHDRIWAKALVIKEGNKKYVILTLDVLGLPPNVKPQLIEKISSYGWTLENVMLLPSHSHSSFDLAALNDKNNINSPQIGIFQPELLEFVIETLSNLIKEADKNLKAVKIGTSSTLVENMNRNRRGDPDVDRELTVTRIDYANGQPMTVLVNWTAHPTFMSERDMWVSGGWPGYLQRELEQWIGNGVTVMYYNGAEGDQSPIGKGGKSHYETAEIYAREMAIKVLELHKNTITKTQIEFDYNFNTLDLPQRKVHPSFMETGGEEYNLTPEVLELVLKVLSPEKTNICALRIGELLIVGAPGEMAAGLGMGIKHQLKEKGIKHPTIGGLANEWISYILSADQYNHGAGYESSVSFYGDQLGMVIVDGMLKTSIPLTQ